MTDTLIVRLPEQDDADASWLLVGSDGRALGAVQSGSLLSAAALSAGRRVVVLVPGVEVSLAEPELPVRGGVRLAQVIPFALEEQLADDVDGLHFAAGRRIGERPGTPVAVVSRARLEAWLELLHAAQIYADALYADVSALPSNPGQTVLLVEHSRLYVRHPDKQPFVLQAEPLQTALELAGVYAEGESTTAAHVIAYATEEDWLTYQTTLEAARERLADLKIQLLPQGPLPLFAQTIKQTMAADAPLNLLQGAYAPKSRMTDGWKRWRIAAILFGCLIGLNLLGKGIELWRLKQTEKTLDAAIGQTFHEAMPGEQNTANARRRMEARLAEVRGSGGGDGSLLHVLSAIGGAVSQVPDTSLDALSFRGTVLDMRVAAKDVNSLDRLQSLVNQRGLSAQLQSSNARATGVEGNIQITTPSPSGKGPG
jgi:general secretion pathway protein L